MKCARTRLRGGEDSMFFVSLTALSEDRLRQEQRRRLWIGLLLLLAVIAAAFAGVRLALSIGEGSRAFLILLAVLAVDMAIAAFLVHWLTRPLHERTRRRRLLMRQVIGAFPGDEQ